MIGREVFFDGWDGVVRVVVLALLGYAALITMLRLARKRTIAQMNVFDFVYIVVVGDVLAIMILDEQVSLAEGAAGLSVLVALQVLFSWLTTRSKRVSH